MVYIGPGDIININILASPSCTATILCSYYAQRYTDECCLSRLHFVHRERLQRRCHKKQMLESIKYHIKPKHFIKNNAYRMLFKL